MPQAYIYTTDNCSCLILLLQKEASSVRVRSKNESRVRERNKSEVEHDNRTESSYSCMIEKSLTKNKPNKQQNCLFTISIFPVGLQRYTTWDREKEKQKHTHHSSPCVKVSISLYIVLMAVGIRCFLWWFFPVSHSLCPPSLLTLLFFTVTVFYHPPHFFGREIWFTAVSCLAISIFFYFDGSFSASFSFCMVSVERLISIVAQSFCKMFRLYFIVLCCLQFCQSCRLIVPAELLNGCIFDPMIVSVSHAGFSINRDNCNSAIAKHVFAEQPLVYYGRAKSVKNIYFLVQSKCFLFLSIL